MNTRNHILQVAVLLLVSISFASSARAQAPAGAPPPLPPGGDVIYFAAPVSDLLPPPEAIEFVEFEGGVNGKTVAGAPFSATVSSQTSQTLADGNRIQRDSTGKFARDSQGRTRRDMTVPDFGPWAASGKVGSQVSMIHDPVAGVHYMLDPEQKVARKFEAGKREGHGRNHEPRGAATDATAGAPADHPNVVTTSLGTKPINGVSAEGTLITRTIPAGAIGNEKPIVITVERWYSADLQTVVLTKRSDPRTGSSVFQLTNIQRQELDSSLFQVPADYAVRDAGRVRNRKALPPPAD